MIDNIFVCTIHQIVYAVYLPIK